MRIRNINPLGAVDVPLLGRVVDVGEVIEVSAADAAALLPQATNWQPAGVPDAVPAEDAPDPDQTPEG